MAGRNLLKCMAGKSARAREMILKAFSKTFRIYVIKFCYQIEIKWCALWTYIRDFEAFSKSIKHSTTFLIHFFRT